MTIDEYNKDWDKFRRYIERKTKDRCVVSNKNWKKLRDYHLEQYIVTVKHPFGLLFKMIYMSKVHKDIPSIHKIYSKYRRKKEGTGIRIQTKVEAFRRYR
jgi:hypothetical protein